jgi:hypothetical protein
VGAERDLSPKRVCAPDLMRLRNFSSLFKVVLAYSRMAFNNLLKLRQNLEAERKTLKVRLEGHWPGARTVFKKISLTACNQRKSWSSGTGERVRPKGR